MCNLFLGFLCLGINLCSQKLRCVVLTRSRMKNEWRRNELGNSEKYVNKAVKDNGRRGKIKDSKYIFVVVCKICYIVLISATRPVHIPHTFPWSQPSKWWVLSGFFRISVYFVYYEPGLASFSKFSWRHYHRSGNLAVLVNSRRVAWTLMTKLHIIIISWTL